MFKTAVGNIALVPVKFTARDGAQIRKFEFTLTAKRADWEEYRDARFGDEALEVMRDYLKENITDWTGQRFVLLENNEPAPFSPEALDHLLRQPGLLGVIFKAHYTECGGKGPVEKN